MARVAQLREFCARHSLKMISVADLIRHRMKTERFIRRLAEGSIETEFGQFRTVAYGSDLNPECHLALVRGDVAGQERVLVRMHSRCPYGDVFGSTTCDCGRLVRQSLGAIAAEDRGVLVYLHESGPGFRTERDAYGRQRMVSHGRDFMHYKDQARAAATATRTWHRRPDSLGPGLAHHPLAHQPPAEDRCIGRVWHRNRGSGSVER